MAITCGVGVPRTRSKERIPEAARIRGAIMAASRASWSNSCHSGESCVRALATRAPAAEAEPILSAAPVATTQPLSLSGYLSLSGGFFLCLGLCRQDCRGMFVGMYCRLPSVRPPLAVRYGRGPILGSSEASKAAGKMTLLPL